MAPQIAVIILNWNGADNTIACLTSLREATVPAHLIVVDNGSTDNSVSRIAASGLADELVEARENLGYAEGNNAGLRSALEGGFPVLAVLNNDTLVPPDALGALLEALQAPEARAVSPDIRYLRHPQESWFAGGILDRGWPRHLQPGELAGDDRSLRSSECLSGCCIVARRETWERVGLFDPAFFLIFEDSDWCLRASAEGVRLYVVTASTILHHVSASLGHGPSSLLSSYYFVRNGLRFEIRHSARYLPRFAVQWLVRPAPALLQDGRGWELAFRWAGAAAFATGRAGRAPAFLERLAARRTR